jgi:hypothetical protein
VAWTTLLSKHLQQVFDQIRLPVIELAGPTPGGYKILQQRSIRLPAPIITNTSKKVTVYAPDDSPIHSAVDEVADVRDLKYKDNTIGIILCSYLPPLGDDPPVGWQEAQIRVDEQYGRALKAATIEKGNFSALHIVLLIEAKRILARGGVLVLQGTHEKDTPLATSLGFTPLISGQEEIETECQIYLK